MLPKPSKWAGATIVTADSVGRAKVQSCAISPSWLAPISITARSVSPSIRNRESGQPMSLLRLPCVLTTR